MESAEEHKDSPPEQSQEVLDQHLEDSSRSELASDPLPADDIQQAEASSPVQELHSNASESEAKSATHQEVSEPTTVSVGTSTLENDELQELKAQVRALEAGMEAKEREIQLLTEQLQRKDEEIEQMRQPQMAPPKNAFMLKSSSRFVLPKPEGADFWGSLEEESSGGLNDLWIARKNQTIKPESYASPRQGYKRNPLTKVIAGQGRFERTRLVNKSLPSKQFRPLQLKK